MTAALDQLSAPIISPADARAIETALFAGDEQKEWAAMCEAGAAVARAVAQDFEEIGGFPSTGRVLVLVGKGHNGGDALLAARAMLERFPKARAEVVFACGERALRPLAARAWRELTQGASARVERRAPEFSPCDGAGFDLCLDGVFGFQFRSPAPASIVELLKRVNTWPIRLRAAVDLPSAGLFRADFTYATGSVKTPVIDAESAGRLRYLDLGFFAGRDHGLAAKERVLTHAVLAPLQNLRMPRSDKRSYGHVFFVGGSRDFPGAIFMAVLAAIRSGAGLVTAFVPESLAPSFAAQLPEAIWVGWPETPEGSLALEGEAQLRARWDRADACVIGPGVGRNRETLALMASIAQNSPAPLVIDADALQGEIVRSGTMARIITPHAGEFARLGGGKDVRALARETGATVVLKGPMTRITAGDEIYHSLFGGPVLARGGSGDLLAGMIGAQLAQWPTEPLTAAARAVAWHGLAADALARAHGQVAIRITQLLDFLGPVLQDR
jgi:ADP-dependent NAD(P)H-hydrate dehydratase / NAD(P)H-hydrate epimerase